MLAFRRLYCGVKQLGISTVDKLQVSVSQFKKRFSMQCRL